MARVKYASKTDYKTFWSLEINTYFQYNGVLYVRVGECDVFDLKHDKVLYWYNHFDSDALVLPITSDRITIKVD